MYSHIVLTPLLSLAPPSMGWTQKLELMYFTEQLCIPTVSPEESSAPSGIMNPMIMIQPSTQCIGICIAQMPGLEKTTKPTWSRGIPCHPKG